METSQAAAGTRRFGRDRRAPQVLFKEGETLWAGWCPLDDPMTTNNVAEYAAMILGLNEIKRRNIAAVGLVGDSKLVVFQINGDWQCRDPKLQALRDRAFDTLKALDSWTVVRSPRESSFYESRRRRGRDVDIPWIRVAATPRP